MRRIPNKKKAQLFKRLRYFLDIEYYSDMHRLEVDAVLEKYGHCGSAVNRQLEVRFRLQHDAFTAVREMLVPDQAYFFIPITMDLLELFAVTREEIDGYMNDHQHDPKLHFIVLHRQLKWVLIKNAFNKVMGLGEPIKVSMRAWLVDPDWKKIMYIMGLNN